MNRIHKVLNSISIYRITSIIFILLISSTSVFSSFSNLLPLGPSSASAETAVPQMMNWEEVWRDYSSSECVYSDIPDEKYWRTSADPPTDPMLSPPGGKTYFTVESGGISSNASPDKNRLSFVLAFFFFSVYESEEVASSAFTKQGGIIEYFSNLERIQKEFPIWLLTEQQKTPGLTEFLTEGKFQPEALSPPAAKYKVISQSSLRDKYLQVEAAPQTWSETKKVQVKDEVTGTVSEKDVYREMGGHTITTFERYKTVIIWTINWAGAMTAWLDSKPPQISTELLKMDEVAMNQQARSIIDRRVRFLQFHPSYWFNWDPDNPLLVRVKVEEKLPPGGEAGLKDERRFQQWDWSKPERPVNVSLRLFRYALEKPLSGTYGDLINTYWYGAPLGHPTLSTLGIHSIGEGGLPTVKIGERNEQCLIFDAPSEYKGYFDEESKLKEIFQPTKYNTGTNGYVDINLVSGEMLGRMGPKGIGSSDIRGSERVIWYINFYGPFQNVFMPTIGSDRMGNVGATVEAFAYYTNKTGQPLDLYRSGREQIKITHIAEVEHTYRTRETEPTQLGYRSGYVYPNYPGEVSTEKKPLKKGDILQPGDVVEIGRYDGITVRLPIVDQVWSLEGNPAVLTKPTDVGFWIVWPEKQHTFGEWVERTRSLSYFCSVVSGTITTVLTENPAAGIFVGALVDVAVDEAKAWILDNTWPTKVKWTRVDIKGTIIAFDARPGEFQIYQLEGQALFADIQDKNLTLQQGQMTKITSSNPTFSSPGTFTAESLPSSIKSMQQALTTGEPPDITTTSKPVTTTTSQSTTTSKTTTTTTTSKTTTTTSGTTTTEAQTTTDDFYYEDDEYIEDGIYYYYATLMEYIPYLGAIAVLVVGVVIGAVIIRRRGKGTKVKPIHAIQPIQRTTLGEQQFCDECGAKWTTGAKFCKVCGTRTNNVPSQTQPTVRSTTPPYQATAFCTNCGARVDPGAKFCQDCGTPAEGSNVR